VFSFERFKWGGIRRDDIAYTAFDLQQFTRAPRLRPTRRDTSLAREILDHLRHLPPETTAAQALPQLTMIKGNKTERQELLVTLGLCGILETRQHPGYSNAFIPYSQRSLPPRRFIFGRYPICWWTAGDGVNTVALEQFLPHLA
jgi:hypothetical protein